jgi:hypothetical protein
VEHVCCPSYSGDRKIASVKEFKISLGNTVLKEKENETTYARLLHKVVSPHLRGYIPRPPVNA